MGISNLSILKVSPTDRSHEKKPYYVLVLYCDENTITTYIPGGHENTITRGSFEWEYHTSRFQKVGEYPDSNKLLYNQKLTFRGCS